MTSRPRAVIFAYACEPGRGSEPGAGWGMVRAIAEFADCIVLTGPEHTGALARWESSNPDSALRFVTVPERSWPAPRHRGRVQWFIAYLRWLPRALGEARRLHASSPFDLACHVSYSVYWLPSPVHSLGIPSVLGPVGGAVTTPRSLWSLLGWQGLVTEMLDYVAVRACAMLPAVQRSNTMATACIVQNDETRERLPASVRESARVLNHALLAESEVPETVGGGNAQRGRGLVLASALETRKGVTLALRAMAIVPDDLHLMIVGDGPERSNLEDLARALRIGHKVTFGGSIPRHELQKLFAQSAAAIFTGLREEGGLALAEAMFAGTPVIVLDHGGAGTIARRGTDPDRVTLVPVASVDGTVRALANAMIATTAQAPRATGPTLDRAAALGELGGILEGVCRTASTVPLALTLTPAPQLATKPGNAVAPGSDVNDRVTVVIPVFNGERFLRAAADSVLRQTHVALTLVIVNDGSTDGTQRVAEEIAARDPRVRVVTTRNGGRARARNIGVRADENSGYLAFLDADDVWDETKLAEQLRALRANGVAAGIGAFMRYISSAGRVLGETGQTIDEQDRERIARGELAPFPISSCLVVTREAYQALSGFDEDLREAEDLDFIARLARHGPILCIAHSLGSYRIHPDSAMARSRARVNMFARFVRRRLAERDAGRELSLRDFEASYRPTWKERRRDAIEIWYRSAALWRGEGQTMRAIRYATMALLAAPAYTVRRVFRQRASAFVGR